MLRTWAFLWTAVSLVYALFVIQRARVTGHIPATSTSAGIAAVLTIWFEIAHRARRTRMTSRAVVAMLTLTLIANALAAVSAALRHSTVNATGRVLLSVLFIVLLRDRLVELRSHTKPNSA